MPLSKNTAPATDSKMSPRTLGASIPSSSSCETNINGSVVTCVANSRDKGLLHCVHYFRWGTYSLRFFLGWGEGTEGTAIPNTINKTAYFHRYQRLRCLNKALTRERDRVILANHQRINTLKGASKSSNSGNFRVFKSRKSQ